MPLSKHCTFPITPSTLSAVTVNKVCGSGLQAVMQGAQSIKAGDTNIVVAGGMENMSNAPHLAHVRSGIKFGEGKLIDHMQHDGLTCPFENWGMGCAAEWTAEEFNISAMRDPALCKQADLVKKYDKHASGFNNLAMAKRFEKTQLYKDTQKRNPDKLAKYEAKVQNSE